MQYNINAISLLSWSAKYIINKFYELDWFSQFICVFRLEHFSEFQNICIVFIQG